MAAEAGRLIRQIDVKYDERIISDMLMLRYCMLDIDQEFQPQYKRNMDCLINRLKELTKRGGHRDE